jgi:hypothetical protein
VARRPLDSVWTLHVPSARGSVYLRGAVIETAHPTVRSSVCALGRVPVSGEPLSELS